MIFGIGISYSLICTGIFRVKCSGNDPLMMTLDLRKLNLDKHGIIIHKVSKVRARRFNSPAAVRAHSDEILKPLNCIGLNPYKAVEMWNNY